MIQEAYEAPIFHRFLTASCIIAPTLLLSTFVIKMYINKKNFTCCAISNSIAYYPDTVLTHDLSIAATCLAVFFGFFVCICRQVQIHNKFYHFFENHSWACRKDTAKAYDILNKVAVWFNITMYVFVPLFVYFDSQQYGIIHPISAAIAIIFSMVFLFIQVIVTFKQRVIEYKIERKIGKEREITWYETWKNIYWTDAILMFILLVIAIIGISIYMAEFMMLGDERLGDDVQVPGYANVAEWICFFASISSVMVLALSFNHDECHDELMDFWRRNSKKLSSFRLVDDDDDDQ